MKTLPPLVVLIGPTAVGKTEYSIQLADLLDGEIVSADSRLFYLGLDIGTAKPSREDMDRVPHHLIDNLQPDEPYSLAEFQQAAFLTIQEIIARKKLPLLVGGTGQYVRAITEGWSAPPVPSDLNLRDVLESISAEHGVDWLHDRLRLLDPFAAEKIDPRNVRRTIRALEVIFLTGKPFSAQRRQQKPPYEIIQIGLRRPRVELYARIDARIDTMMSAGFGEEVRSLLGKGYRPDLPSLSAIGYPEMIAFIKGEISQEEAVQVIRRKTRIYVRRQANWFKETDPNIRWFDAGIDPVHDIASYIRVRLKYPP